MTQIRIAKCLICILFISATVFSQKLVYDDSFAPEINGTVDRVKILDDQKILIAGSFTAIDGQPSNNIARLNQDGSLDPSFNANWLSGPNNSTVNIRSLNVQANGKILLAGNFPYNGSSLPTRIFRLNADGSLDNTLTSIPYLEMSGNTAGEVVNVQQMPDGKMLVCGNFDKSNGNPQPDLARYNSDGSFDPTFTTAINSSCSNVVVQPDGKYFVSGVYWTVNGSPREGLTRFNPDDSVDTSFNAPTFHNTQIDTYSGIKLNSDGTIYAKHYYPVNGSLLHLNADGSLRKRFYANFTGGIEVLSTGKIMASGTFSGGANSQNYNVNRFTPDGRHDGSLGQLEFGGAENPTRTLEIDDDDKVIIGGSFTRIVLNRTAIYRSHLARFIPQPVSIIREFDFDGDGKDDPAVYRPSERVWYLNQTTSGFSATQFGLPTDQPVAADYDGDGRADIAVFREGVWYWLRSSDGAFAYGATGQAGDIPQPGFRGNFGYLACNCVPTLGLFVFRPSEAAFYIQPPFHAPQTVNLQQMTVMPTDQPVSADYDGDYKDDIAVFRDGDWFYLSSNDSLTMYYRFGLPGDKPVPADYDGDGRADYAVYRPSTGIWYIQQSTNGFAAARWGLAGDLPVPGDYDGDGKTDIAVYRDGFWYMLFADGSTRVDKFGTTGDIPVQLRIYN